MSTEVIMPQMGESIFEGTITRWLKKPGEAVAKDEPLFEISTDKVDAEIPSPAAGIVTEIRFAAGETVQVNTVVALLGEAGSAVTAAPAARTAESPAPAAAAPAAPAPVAPAAATPPQGGGTEVVMPQMGESIFEGTITRWLKQPGEAVAKDEPLFEISTDKVDAEIPAPVAGILSEIRVPAGATVQVNVVVAVIGGAVGAAAPVSPAAPPSPSPAAGPSQPAPAPQQGTQPVPIAGRDKIRSSPLVRRIARENQIDLAYVPGTGSGGRINKDDILAYVAHPQPLLRPSTPAAPAPRQGSAPQTLKEETVPMTRMRAIIAERMTEAKRTVPHAHTVYKVDMTRIARLRARERKGFEQRNGVKLTYMPFIAAAAAEALTHFPILNASLEGQNIHYHAGVHLGIAVALEWGLIVPVVRNAHATGFVQIARAIADLADRARTKRLRPDEVGGSTFTLTNSGVFGGEFGTPILNQPESAILAIGGLRKEPVVVTDQDGNDSIAIRSMQYYCLGFDHRLIDGADSGKFMTTFKTILETWDRPIE